MSLLKSRRRRGVFALLFAASFAALAAVEPQTERNYLSGHGPKDAVPWEFTVTGGRRAGEKTTIQVPSNWEQHGFGTYNYGLAPVPRSDEHGLYHLRFAVPEAWKDRRIRLVFDGVMTDATVKVNGHLAGPTHQGAFYRFGYDITPLVKFGAEAQNELEVDVAKTSANAATDLAERGGDYWVFGGIFRPVWLEAAPKQAITHVAIDARADGQFTADLALTPTEESTEVNAQIFSADGESRSDISTTRIPAGGTGRLRIAMRLDSPRLWTAETPNLYRVKLTLRKGDEVLHTVTQRFGFRTFEVRAGQGLFLNGQRIFLKGVNRHSFRPETARALNPEDCYEDARLIRSLNMNAVRMSHYPPDEAFLEACDELGLYVLDELSGWHHAHETEVGRRLVREMVERDVNHPSILFWDSGNEGGWNRELDGEFALHDPQRRRVILPSDTHDDLDTKHYPPYEDLIKKLHGPNLVMPTEFIHALYDGGGGAGLEDYWNAITASPVGSGGFIWSLFDEGVVRTDQGGRIDVFASYAPDGLVGPHHEKEGSYYAVRDLWSPVQIAAPSPEELLAGKLSVTNHYDFIPLAQCRFTWRLVRYSGPMDPEASATVLGGGSLAGPALAPHESGKVSLSLPENVRDADALLLTVHDPNNQELWTWTWPTAALTKRRFVSTAQPSGGAGSLRAPQVEVAEGEIRLVAGDVAASFDAANGFLRAVRRGAATFALSQGPRLTFGRPEAAGATEWLAFESEDQATQTRRLAAPHPANTLEILLDYVKSDSWAGFQLEISPDGKIWKTIFDGLRRSGDGQVFNFPPQPVTAVRLSKVLRANGQPIAVKSVRLGYAPSRFPGQMASPAKVAHGTERDPQSGEQVAWIEAQGAGGLDRVRWSLSGNGSLDLEYVYALSGEFLYHGVTFDFPEGEMKSLRWLGGGPYRVWKNRLRGASFGVHEIARNVIQPGESWNFPEFQGNFADLRWARLETNAGAITIENSSPGMYLRVGTPRINHFMTTVDFPSGDISFLQAIPAMGSKFVTPDASGPSGRPAMASGEYRGKLRFQF